MKRKFLERCSRMGERERNCRRTLARPLSFDQRMNSLVASSCSGSVPTRGS